MSRTLFVGNLSYTTTEQDLQAAFGEVGTVERVRLIVDPETGKPRGFGFVDMVREADAQAAIEGFDGAEFGGRTLNVSVAKERPAREGHQHRRRESRKEPRRESRW